MLSVFDYDYTYLPEGGGGGGWFPGIFGGGVPPGYLNPDYVHFTRVFRPGLLNPYPFSDLIYLEIRSSFLY